MEDKSRRVTIYKIGDQEENKDKELPFEEIVELNFL